MKKRYYLLDLVYKNLIIVQVILEVKNIKKSIDAFALLWELYRRYNQKEKSVKVREVKNVHYRR